MSEPLGAEPREASSKGAATRGRILLAAQARAARLGLEGLTIGDLAAAMGLSKSGLFAHFKSKENLQLAVLDAAAEDFATQVFGPALKLPRGEPRLRAILQGWMAWSQAAERPGGCIFLAGAMEWDDRPGPIRDAIVARFEQLLSSLGRAVELCVAEGHLPQTLDVELVTTQLHAVVLKHHLDARLLQRQRADELAERAINQILCRTPLDGHARGLDGIRAGAAAWTRRAHRK